MRPAARACDAEQGRGFLTMLYAGTSGFSYAGWKGTFYPATLAGAKMLAYYAQRLNGGNADPGKLLAGDTLFAGSIGRTDFPGGSCSR